MTGIKLMGSIIGMTLGLSAAVLIPSALGVISGAVIGVYTYKLFLSLSVIEYEVEIEDDETFI